MSDTTLNAAGSGSIADTRLHDIVVGVDGSDESFAALRWALNEASLTGQQVNAVFAWSHSWDMGSEPEDEEQWAEVRHDIAQKLRDWVSEASQGMTINEDHVKLTSVKATGTSALLEIGRDAQQIVVGRRSLGRVAAGSSDLFQLRSPKLRRFRSPWCAFSTTRNPACRMPSPMRLRPRRTP